jgi:hypothetical protein
MPRTGLVCACLEDSTSWAHGLRRDSLFEALQSRYVYGTTAERLIMWLNIDRTGGMTASYPMGSEGSGDLSADSFTAVVHVAKDGEDLAEVRLMAYDPDAASWSVCKTWTTGTYWPTYLTATVNLETEGCADEGEFIYYLVAEQEFIRETQFRVSNINRYIDFDFKDNGTAIGLTTATLDTAWYASGATMAAEVEAKLEGITGTGTIDVSYDSGTHEFTIEVEDAANDQIEIRWETGSNGTSNAALLLGYSRGSDLGWGTSYTSDFAIESDGLSYRGMAWSSPIWMDYVP